MSNINNYPELSKLNGTIGNVMVEAFNTINNLINDQDISDEEFQDIIIELIEQKADKASEKKKQEFIKIIKQKRTKQNIAIYIGNFVLKGDGLKVI